MGFTVRMDFFTIMEGTDEVPHLNEMLNERADAVGGITNEEIYDFDAALFGEREDRISEKINGQPVTAARLKEVVYESIEEMRGVIDREFI